MTPLTVTNSISNAVAALGDGPLTESALAQHAFPLFSKVLAHKDVYLANHSLGRPLNQTGDDLAEAFNLWQSKLDGAWEHWLAERENFRARIAQLIGAPRADCIVPKTAAGQGLRTVLNAMPGKPRVLSTRGEFDSLDVILKQYTRCGRIEMLWSEADARGEFDVERLIAQLDRSVDLVVVSQVMFMTGQIVEGLDRLATACHRAGTRLLVDAYHAVGVIPVDVAAMGADFLIGASYKYLRGGPGAGYLYISPEALSAGFQPLDTGWFAKRDFFQFERPDPPVFQAGGDAFLEGTPPVFTWYQARAGQQFVLGVGVERLRAYGLDRLCRLQEYLRECAVEARSGDARHGAFLTVRHPHAMEMPEKLAALGVRVDARGDTLRLAPDCLTRDEEMVRAAKAVAEVFAKI
ncbi:MAG: aminotransferase class V-fold PLP-dependent enzyme [Acidobacteriaceae bacterium]